MKKVLLMCCLAIFTVGCSEESRVRLLRKTYPNASIAKVPDQDVWIVKKSNGDIVSCNPDTMSGKLLQTVLFFGNTNTVDNASN